MAQGRMINTAICKDKTVACLSNDTSRLGFTWLIPHADKEGRTYGDPAIVRSMIFPRRDDISLDEMEGYIKEWAAAGLIVWYEVDGDHYIWFPAFDKNQTGLRKDREANSRIPPPPTPEYLRWYSDKYPEQLPVKLMEWNGMESNAPDGAESQKPSGQLPTIVKNPRAFRALQAHEKRRANGEPDLSWLDEYLWPLARQFIVSTDIEPVRSEHSKWIKDLKEFWEYGIRAEDIPKAVKKMRTDELTIKGPASIFGILRDQIAKSQSGGEAFTEIH